MNGQDLAVSEHPPKRRPDGTLYPGQASVGGFTRKLSPEEYFAKTQRQVTLRSWGRIVRRAVIQAIEGDSRAREWLTKMLLEQPSGQGVATSALEKLKAVGPEHLRMVLREVKRTVEVGPTTKVTEHPETTITQAE